MNMTVFPYHPGVVNAQEKKSWIEKKGLGRKQIHKLSHKQGQQIRGSKERDRGMRNSAVRDRKGILVIPRASEIREEVLLQRVLEVPDDDGVLTCYI